MPTWIEIAVFSAALLFIVLQRIAARFKDRRKDEVHIIRGVEFHDIWHRRKNDD